MLEPVNLHDRVHLFSLQLFLCFLAEVKREVCHFFNQVFHFKGKLMDKSFILDQLDTMLQPIFIGSELVGQDAHHCPEIL
jgi:hypothetical protein